MGSRQVNVRAMAIGTIGAVAIGAAAYGAMQTEFGRIAVNPAEGFRRTGSPGVVVISGAAWLGPPAGLAELGRRAGAGAAGALAAAALGAMVLGVALGARTARDA